MVARRLLGGGSGKNELFRTAKILSIVPEFLGTQKVKYGAAGSVPTDRIVPKNFHQRRPTASMFPAWLGEVSAVGAELSSRDTRTRPPRPRGNPRMIAAEKGILNDARDILDADLHRHDYEITYVTDETSAARKIADSLT